MPSSPTEQELARERRANLRQLADRLIARHIRIAVPDLEVRDQLVARGEARYDVELVEREMRCIAVVGAGASDAVLKRSKELADELEAEFGRDDDELERVRLVNNLESVDVDFEARLVALSKSPAAERKVREKISELYGVRYPSLLGYELLAHLLKHRFLDAIVTFNFDELLDQSLDDELNANEYVKVISERDCTDIVSDPEQSDYVPLYVKLHGTASEPDSLRYTPQSYYALPPRILTVVRDLMRCDNCVVVNIGSNLGSFDFQRLLRIPRDLKVFNVGRLPVPASVVRKIDAERMQALHDDEAGGGDGEPVAPQQAVSCSGHAGAPDVDWLLDCNARGEGCDRLMSRLTKKIRDKTDRRSDGLVDFRSVRRHRTIARLLGPETLHRGWLDDPRWARREWTEYCRRRAILELAFAGAKARGLLSMGPLALDRPARYFERYCRLTEGHGDDWHKLCAAAGLIESRHTPDVLHSLRELRLDRDADDDGADRRLNAFDLNALALHVLARIKNPVKDSDVVKLRETFRVLQERAEIEFHMRDDRVCSKAFEQPATLPTSTSRRAYTWLMLQDLKPQDEVHVCAETGNWLLYDRVKVLLKECGVIRVLLAFDSERGALEEHYGDRIKIAVVDPWRHNRHMTIVCREGHPTSAIYFARRLRAPVVTAVYLKNTRDVVRLMRLYDERWGEGVSFPFPAFKDALEAGDVARLLTFYDGDAEWVDHRQEGPPSPPRTLRGRETIARHMHDVGSEDATYEVTDEILSPEHVAFAVSAVFADGRRTRRDVHLYLRRGLIARRIDVEVHER